MDIIESRLPITDFSDNTVKIKGENNYDNIIKLLNKETKKIKKLHLKKELDLEVDSKIQKITSNLELNITKLLISAFHSNNFENNLAPIDHVIIDNQDNINKKTKVENTQNLNNEFTSVAKKYKKILTKSKQKNFNETSELNDLKLQYQKMLKTMSIDIIDKDFLKKNFTDDYLYILRREVEKSKKLNNKKILDNLQTDVLTDLKIDMNDEEIMLVNVTSIMINLIKTIYKNNLNYYFNSSYFGKILNYNLNNKKIENINLIKDIKSTDLLNFFSKKYNLNINKYFVTCKQEHPTIFDEIKPPKKYSDQHTWFKLSCLGQKLISLNNVDLFKEIKNAINCKSAVSRDKVKKEIICIKMIDMSTLKLEYYTNEAFRNQWNMVDKTKPNIEEFLKIQSYNLCVCTSCINCKPHWNNGKFHKCGCEDLVGECPVIEEYYKFCSYGPFCNDKECAYEHLDPTDKWLKDNFFCYRCININTDKNNTMFGLSSQDELSIQTCKDNKQLTCLKCPLKQTACSCLHHFKTIFDKNKIPPINGCYFGIKCTNMNCKFGHGYTSEIHNVIYNHKCIGKKCSKKLIPQMVNYRGYRNYNSEHINDGYYCNMCNYTNLKIISNITTSNESKTSASPTCFSETEEIIEDTNEIIKEKKIFTMSNLNIILENKNSVESFISESLKEEEIIKQLENEAERDAEEEWINTFEAELLNDEVEELDEKTIRNNKLKENLKNLNNEKESLLQHIDNLISLKNKIGIRTELKLELETEINENKKNIKKIDKLKIKYNKEYNELNPLQLKVEVKSLRPSTPIMSPPSAK